MASQHLTRGCCAAYHFANLRTTLGAASNWPGIQGGEERSNAASRGGTGRPRPAERSSTWKGWSATSSPTTQACACGSGCALFQSAKARWKAVVLSDDIILAG